MLCGLFLSKFSQDGLRHLGFSTYSEAYNAMGFALGAKPTSIKNYMQEFDPMFPNGRKGWRGREMRQDRREMFERYGHLSLEALFELLKPILLPAVNPELPEDLRPLVEMDEEPLENNSFSKRLITGIAAERFFESAFPNLDVFENHLLSNVTRFGCGFDFRIDPDHGLFLAAEVKGIAGAQGEIRMTQKEHRVAGVLRDRYYLCVVRNFIERPVLSLYRNPLEHGLAFERREQTQTTISWHARISG